MTIVVFTICTALALPAFASENDGFKQMFDGKTTKGWINPYPFGKATVEEGEIVLRGNPKFFLVTEKTYGDFILEAEVNVPVGGNSGIQARCHYKTNPNGKTRLWGYQAEVDTSDRKWAGGLYDEGRRGWLNPLEGKHEAQAAFKNGQWNHYRVEAIGDHLRFWVNGVLTTDYWDSVDIEGHIALQHHGEKGKTYRFRNVRIKELGKRQWEKIFDGKTLNGWHERPGGKWEVKDGILIGTGSASAKTHGLLITDKVYQDFTVRLKFKVIEGNSGLYFRIKEVDKAAHTEGFQAEIADTLETGGLYETYGRAWVVKSDEEAMKKHYKPGEWAEMTVSAHGRRIVVHVNGYKTAELNDDPGRLEGKLAFQLHAGQDMNVQFKDIEILGEAK